MFYIEDSTIISSHHSRVIAESVLGNNFPWYFQQYSTSEKFPFFAHTLIPRGNDDAVTAEPVSNYYDFFHDIFETFCIIHNLKVKRVLRACLNLSIPNTKFEYSDPHVDHMFPHYVMLMYLNDVTNGNTIIFKEQTNGEISEHPLETINDSFAIEKEVTPAKGKIVVFDGSHFHANRFCVEPERRVVCVFTFTTEEHVD